MTRRIISLIVALALVVCLSPICAIEAKAASAMKASDEVILFIKTMEGFSAIPQWDYVQWTVGYGNRCPDEHLERYLAEGIPIEEADALFLEQLAGFEAQVNAFMDRNGLNFTQSQFDAVLSITYNCGPAWLTGSSDLKQAIIDGATGNKLVGIMSQWCTAGGKYLSGLMRRRLMEVEMYLNGQYSTVVPDHYCYVFYDAGEGTASGVAQGFDCNLYAIPMVTATREGYTFLGWYTEETGGVKVTYLDENMHLDTLYAHWQKGEGEYTGNTTEVPDGIMVTVTGDVLNVRSGPGTGYSIVGSVICGEVVVVTQIAYATDGRAWGKIDKGWISLAYTDYSEVTGDDDTTQEDSDPIASLELPISATIIGSGTVNLYNGPDTGYPKVGTLQPGDEVQLVETYKMFSVWWARLSTGGWICMDQHILLDDAQKLAHSVTVTVTSSYVNVRSGPGTSYAWSGSLNYGNSVEILAVETVGSALWGRFSDGWISLQYTNFDSSKLDYYRNHSYGQWYTASESTCATHGQLRQECLYCDHYVAEELPLVDHTLGDWYVAQESTCVTVGHEQRDCLYCDYCETMELPLTDHTMGDWYEYIAPTLTECGEDRRSCLYCDYYETRVTDPVEHIFGEWYVYREATCTEAGERRRDCVECGHYESEQIEAAGHSYCDWYISVEPTYEEDGQERRDCQNCEHYETRAKAFNGEVTVRVYATVICYSLNVRSGPGTGYSRVGAVSYGTVHEVFERITVSGKVWGRIEQGWICLTGNTTLEEITEVTPHTHSFGDWYTVTEATCTEAGLRRHDCACGHYETEAVAATGHSYGAWYTVTEATCTEAGLRRHDCACGHYETEAVAATGHSYGDWYTVTEATASQNGLERRNCACGHYETRETVYEGTTVTKIYATITVSSLNVRSGPGTGYSWVGAVAYGTVHEVLEQTTVGNKVWGRIEKGWICLTGYTTLEEVTEAEEHSHSFGAWYTVTEATCTANGEKRRDCSCGEYETEVIAATGHSYGEWYTVTEVTASQNGLERRDCACGHYETRETAYEGTTVTKIYATITVSSLNVRSGAGSSYSWVGYVVQGERYEVYEQTTVGSKVWGRIDKGWICLTGYTTLEEVTETESADSTATVMTVRAVVLNVRSGAGTGYGIVASLGYGTEVTVLETKTVGNTTWARIEQGWVSMTYLK